MVGLFIFCLHAICNMRMVFLLLGLAYFNISPAQDTIWFEDFSGVDDNTTSRVGPPGWSSGHPCTYLGDGHWEVRSERWSGNDLEGTGACPEAVWTSEWIDISSETDVQIALDLASSANMEAGTDYLQIYYKLDNDPETLLTNGDQAGSFFQSTGVTCGAGLNGDSIQIVIRAFNTASNEYYYFDNILVYSGNDFMEPGGANTLYAVVDGGNWSFASTWSASEGGPGGAGPPLQPAMFE